MGRGAMSAGGTTRPEVSLTGPFPFPFPAGCLSVSISQDSPSGKGARSLLASSTLCLLPLWFSICDRSSEGSSSSSNNSPSAVSKSGGAIHSLGTTQGKATPMLAARFSQPGPVRPVSFSQRYCVKWLQFLLRRLYAVPWKASDASFIMASTSDCGRTVKPCKISHLKVPPGGTCLGAVQ